MNCQDLKHRTFEYLDGTLPSQHRRQAELHLASCEPCREAITAQHRTAELLRRRLRNDTQSLSLFSTVEATILNEARSRSAVQRRWAPVCSAALAAGVTLACLCLGGRKAGPATAFSSFETWSDNVPTTLVMIQDATPVTRYTFEHRGEEVTDYLIQSTRTDEAILGGF